MTGWRSAFRLFGLLLLMQSVPVACHDRQAIQGDPADRWLPEAIVGRPYNYTFCTSGMAQPVELRVIGELPPGLRLDTQAQAVLGVPELAQPEAWRFELAASS